MEFPILCRFHRQNILNNYSQQPPKNEYKKKRRKTTHLITFPILHLPLWLVVLDPLRLPPFGSSILEPHLNPRFCQVDFHSQIFPSEHIRIVSLSESSFQLLQLLKGERCPVTTLFSTHKRLIGHSRVVRVSGI